MRRFTILCIAAFLAVGVAVSAAEEFSEVEYYKRLAERQLAEMNGVCEPANTLLVIPQYFHSRVKSGTLEAGGGVSRFTESRANGAGVTAFYNRAFTDAFSLGLFYQYGFLNVRGGAPFVDGASSGDTWEEHTRWYSHVVGVQPEFNLGAFGRLVPSVTQMFDFGGGEQTRYNAAGVFQESAPFGDEGAVSTSLMVWYEKDFNFCENWTVTPFAGARSIFTKLKSANPGIDGSRLRNHFLAGGLKVAYQGEFVGFNFRAGVSHRTNPGEGLGYGDRAVANGVAFFSHQANMDKTVGSVGAGISFPVSSRAQLGVNYDGMFGSKTSAHMGTVTFALSF